MNKESFNPSYIGERTDIQKLVLPGAKNVLDVGCSTGALGAAIKANTGAHVTGIELSSQMAQVASEAIDKVFVGGAEEVILNGQLEGLQFDTIIFADVLEHLSDPWTVLRTTTHYLKPGGTIVASIPNVNHIDTLFNLIFRNYWPYRDRGIHDRTHLRFFTKRNIMELFEKAGLSIDKIVTHYRIIEKPHKLNYFAKFLAIPGIRRFLAFQYLIRTNLPDVPKSQN